MAEIMMSATPKKPTTPGTSSGAPRRPSTNPTPSSNNVNVNTGSSRSPTRMAPQAIIASTGTAMGVNRTRSIRNGAPASARAAARKPPGEPDFTAEDVKAEMQAQMDDLHERLQQAEQVVAESQKQATFLQMKLDETMKEQSFLEESVQEQTERLEEMENEKKETLRAKREFEHIYEAERLAAMKEREEAGRKEEEMQHTVQRMLKERGDMRLSGLEDGHGHGHRPSVSRNSSFRSSTTSPNPMEAGGRQFAPPSSLQRSDSRSSSKLVMQKDKVIEALRLELAEVQFNLVEVENMGGGRLQQLQMEMMDIKMQNARLMEENESFQLLLSEKTLNGEFAANSELLHPRPSSNAGSRPPSRQPNTGASLADELAGDGDSMVDGVGYTDDQTRKLQAEVNSVKDQNKALTLYINNIISRLLQHGQFEVILDKTPDLFAGPAAASARYAAAAASAATGVGTEKELPPPPPEKAEKAEKAAEVVEEQQLQPPVGFLQRAKSVMGARRPRPMSYAVSSVDQEKLQQQLKGAEEPKTTHDKLQQQLRADEPPRGAHENPNTAPRIPITRSNFSRENIAHRRTTSDWPAAAPSALVGNMYRGPSPGSQGPVSPGLSSPVGRNSGFFAQGQHLGSRAVSGGGGAGVVPTISENGGAATPGGKENEVPGGGYFLAQRDSKVPVAGSSHRSSVISNGGGGGGSGGGMLDISGVNGVGGEGDTAGLSSSSSDQRTSSDQRASSSFGPSSPPRSTTSSGERDNNVRSGGAVMIGSKPRPLRLVQEAAGQDDAARKAANRGSWFGWMNKGAGVGTPGAGGVGGGRSVSGGGVEGGIGQ
ncbi:hypothetical protein LTR91_019898 [Friedmanniomyces endolithicus]|uniref:Uncharacterized protein n=1 Tax=Friedmanniomyces endolithicus TaxID=329885 RepID=A0AAN6H9Z7_9PEZI|nr:hypothetical protein LTR57_021683 [Friedmanniomyces endolithicus]KAK0960120.1 hypothetical protein LTS01_021054 [Friedmanniomyces endolithicus]KAK0961462.1 hypothetical protein LTR91_019898 [Friedmanniomyces endolithicus]KAK1025691.1 hypothetical protein LTS16_022979 [Friedmanniomyces endolithicus]